MYTIEELLSMKNTSTAVLSTDVLFFLRREFPLCIAQQDAEVILKERELGIVPEPDHFGFTPHVAFMSIPGPTNSRFLLGTKGRQRLNMRRKASEEVNWRRRGADLGSN